LPGKDSGGEVTTTPPDPGAGTAACFKVNTS